MKYAFTLSAVVFALVLFNASSAMAEEGASETMEGYIHAVDLKAGTFVLGGRNESETTFKIGVKTGDKRADCLLMLDGKQAKADALKSGVKATVTYVKSGTEMGASKVELSSKK